MQLRNCSLEYKGGQKGEYFSKCLGKSSAPLFPSMLLNFFSIYLLALHPGSVCKAHKGLLGTAWMPWQMHWPCFLFSGVFRICCASNPGLSLKAASQKMHCKGVKSQNPVISTASMICILFLASPLKGQSGKEGRTQSFLFCCVPSSLSQPQLGVLSPLPALH